MPLKKIVEKARKDKKEGKSSRTQASEFVSAEVDAMKEGSPHVKSRKQAIAVGLSEARRHGVAIPKPKTKKR